jgi:hypothetical protein
MEAFPKLKEIRGRGKLFGQVPIIEEIKAKGVVGVVQEKFPALRGQGLFTAVTPTSQKPGVVEDIYIEPLKGEVSRNLSVQM